MCFENGEDLSLDLENFVVNDNYGFSEKCKKSRTEFIECLKKNGVSKITSHV